MTVDLRLGDCLNILPTLPAASVDAIITDLPYGTTNCTWDHVIPLAPLWDCVYRVLKPRGVFVTTACQPFTATLIMSNPARFLYTWIWRKGRATKHLDCKHQPLRKHEEIPVFGPYRHTYNPQMTTGKPHQRGNEGKAPGPAVYRPFVRRARTYSADYYPTTIIDFPTVQHPVYPTQKPVDLFAYLVLTYTNPGDTVLDPAMGSGTTGVACVQTGRNFIGIEINPDAFSLAQQRIAQAQGEPA